VTVLILGGNGQLGAACGEELAARGVPVRATVRSPDRAAHLTALGAEVVEVDLAKDADRRRDALAGVDTVVMNANSVIPRAGDDPGALEDALLELVEEAVAAGAIRVVLPSLEVSHDADQVPFAGARLALEQRLLAAPLDSWVLKMPPFMDVWLALVGSSIPLRGEPHASVGRPSPFLRTFRRGTATLVENRGIMLVPGSPDHRHAFLSVRDAARATVAAAMSPEESSGPVRVAGPEVLTWRDVADTYARLLGRPVRILSTPAAVYTVATRLLRPVAEVPSRTMALNRYMAGDESPWTSAGGGLLDPESLTTVEDFLRAKLALPAELPSVA
jgi:uncharacterized protein YbjT (DUF2867 family)